ncbi:MAG: exonuclease domain-containing protein [bacterium]|nr:exonuclease domain-containing protein [bacterium]
MKILCDYRSMAIIFFDTETTGIGEEDRLCQLAVKERGGPHPLLNARYKPPVPISFGAMSIHHITQKMVDDEPIFLESPNYGDVKNLFECESTISVAHNAAFDLSMLAREGIVPHSSICTYKVVHAHDAESKFEQYKLQYLRYMLGLEIKAAAHDAMGDVLILEAVFEYLLGEYVKRLGSEDVAIKEMIRISSKPMLYTTIRFGKYSGKLLEEIARTDRSYLEWLLDQKQKTPKGEEDWIYTLRHYLNT